MEMSRRDVRIHVMTITAVLMAARRIFRCSLDPRAVRQHLRVVYRYDCRLGKGVAGQWQTVPPSRCQFGPASTLGFCGLLL